MALTKFFTAFLPFLLIPLYFPSLKLQFFAPFLITILYKKPFFNALWWAFFTGLLQDLLSATHHLGLFGLGSCLTLTALRPLKKHFFEDSLSTIPLMTLFFSIFFTLLQVVLFSLFESSPPLSLKWIATDLFFFPLLDALYAFLLFTLPQLFFPRFSDREYFSS